MYVVSLNCNIDSSELWISAKESVRLQTRICYM